MKSYVEMPERVRELLDNLHGGIALEVEYASDHVQPGKRLLMVGSGPGGFARYAAWCFEASELIMVDSQVPPDEFEPFCPESYHQIDVMTAEFVDLMRGKADIILSFMLTHELADPEKGLTNILSVLPKEVSSFAWFLDLSAYRWRKQDEDYPSGVPEEYLEHVRLDLENVKRHCLDDQDHVYGIYERAIRTTGHEKRTWQIVNGGYNHVQDIYEVTVGHFR